MNRPISAGVLVALLGTGLTAQANQIVITTSTWVISPAQQQIFTPLVVINPFGDNVVGGCYSYVGTSATNSPHLAAGTIQGTSQGLHGTVGGSLPTQTALQWETYSRGLGGTVNTTLLAQMDPGSIIHQTGVGNRATANASVSITCPAFSLSAACSGRITPGGGGSGVFLSTAPMSATATANTSSWYLTMSSTCDSAGSISSVGHFRLEAVCTVVGQVVLN